ncbi:SDR family oxidoreductase [Salinadaptatus halalkaliphilus]|uniref:SDR family oxidoreductase n=1 Tax=Salinadaptatus halalkaliphilus TaxID=2419781 RepID=A0A4S3TQ42_9EURY|nr:NAD-dependent epimerase/dehydratase family protein [Salinadaptatus halalkaliphilus]THE66461.1 SDR family oxidoreductase [Salinadaptatus halalkaliphilus]
MSDRVGVLGATGYVGSAITTVLRANGYDVSPAAGSTHETYPTVDVRNRMAVSTFLEDVDYVVNATGVVGIDACADRSGLAFEINATGAATVAWACRRQNVALVHLSSVATIGTPKRQPITADTPREPDTIYGETKLLGERAVQTITDGEVPSITFCPTNVYGAHESSSARDARNAGSSSVVDFFLEQAITADILPVHRPGTQQLDLIHVSDVADGVATAIDRLGELERTARSYVLGRGEAYSVLELAGFILAQCHDTSGWAPALELRDPPADELPPIDRFDVETTPLASDLDVSPDRDVTTWIETVLEGAKAEIRLASST